MVKKKIKVTRLRNNLLNIGLFVTLVLALVFIGSYQYTNSDSRLKGELATYTDWRMYDSDNIGENSIPEIYCYSNKDCGVELYDVPYGGVHTFTKCLECDTNIRKCVAVDPGTICGAYTNKVCSSDQRILQTNLYLTHCTATSKCDGDYKPANPGNIHDGDLKVSYPQYCSNLFDSECSYETICDSVFNDCTALKTELYENLPCTQDNSGSPGICFRGNCENF